MTFTEFKASFLRYLKANEIMVAPIVSIGTETPGGETITIIAAPVPSATAIPQEYWIWFNSAGQVHCAAMNLLHASSDQDKSDEAGEIRRFFHFETDAGEMPSVDAKVKWQDFLNPPPAQAAPVGPVGPAMTGHPGFFRNMANITNLGSTVTTAQGTYVLLPLPGTMGLFGASGWRLLA